MMNKVLATIAFSFVLATSALAQAPQPAQPQQQAVVPPTPIEMEQSRAAMLEAQLRYFVTVLRNTEAALQQKDSDAKILAAWWASYVAGLPPSAASAAK